MNLLKLHQLIDQALQEDIGYRDMTTEAVIPRFHQSTGEIIAKQNGIVAGLIVAEKVFMRLDPTLQFESNVAEGARVESGTVLAVISGSTRSILTAERVALNLLQRMSGIATATRDAVEAVHPYPAKITDTRKTTPGLRMLEKYAVSAGGGVNHRFGLDDAVLIKDNHITVAGGITQAVQSVRKSIGHLVKMEVETETLEQVREAISCGVDVIMLDNMSVDQMKQAISIIPEAVITEASGGISLETIHQVASTGVQFISLGWITHSAKSLDISLNLKGSVKN